MTTHSLKSLLAALVLCSFALPAFAYTSSGGTTISGTPGYQSDDQDAGAMDDADTTQAAPTYKPSQPLRSQAVPIKNNATLMQNNGVISNPQVIGACLCQEADYKALGNQMAGAQTAYNQAVAQRAAYDSQIAGGRGTASSPNEIETIRLTSEKRIALQGRINDEYIPAVQRTTAQYNASVTQYQQSCAGKSFDVDVTTRLQANLQCNVR